MPTLIHLKDAAPQFGKSEESFRYWIAKADCPLKPARIGGRLMLTQEQIDAYIESAFAAANA